MNCPRCNQNLRSESYEGVEVDRCERCSGVWLDYGEIQFIVETEGETFSPSQVTETLKNANTQIPDSEKESVELCPKCKSSMSPMNFNYGSGVITDVCPNGHGMWLDKGELDRVQISFENAEREATRRKPELKAALNREASAVDKAMEKNRVKRSTPLGKLLSVLFDI